MEIKELVLRASFIQHDMAKSIIDQLASSLGQRDEQPNIALAVKIAKSGNEEQVDELFSLLVVVK